MAAENNSRQVAAIDGFGNRTPEICGSEPGLLVCRDGRTRYLVKPELFRVCRSARIADKRVVSGQLLKNGRRDRIDQVNFTALESQSFNLRVLFNVEPYGVEIRKLLSRRLFLPVVGIPLQQQIRSGFSLRYVKRPQSRHFLLRRFCRKDRNRIEKIYQISYRRRKID